MQTVLLFGGILIPRQAAFGVSDSNNQSIVWIMTSKEKVQSAWPPTRKRSVHAFVRTHVNLYIM